MNDFIKVDYSALDDLLFEEKHQNILDEKVCSRWADLCEVIKAHQNDEYGSYLDMNLETYPLAAIAVSILWYAMEDKDKKDCSQKTIEILKKMNEVTQSQTGVKLYVPSDDMDLKNIINCCDRNEMQNCCKMYFAVLGRDAPFLVEFLKSIYLSVFETNFDSKWIERQYDYAENYKIYESDYNEQQHSFAKPESYEKSKESVNLSMAASSEVNGVDDLKAVSPIKVVDKNPRIRPPTIISTFEKGAFSKGAFSKGAFSKGTQKTRSVGTSRTRRWRTIKTYLIVSGIIITAVLWLIFSGIMENKESETALNMRIKTTGGEMVSVTRNMEEVEWDLGFGSKKVDFQGVVETFKTIIIAFVIYRCVLIVGVLIAQTVYTRHFVPKEPTE